MQATDKAKDAVRNNVDTKMFWTGIAVLLAVGGIVYASRKAGFGTVAKIAAGGK